jgi:hypothetical protein
MAIRLPARTAGIARRDKLEVDVIVVAGLRAPAGQGVKGCWSVLESQEKAMDRPAPEDVDGERLGGVGPEQGVEADIE